MFSKTKENGYSVVARACTGRIFIDLHVEYKTASNVTTMTAAMTATLFRTSNDGERLPFTRNISKAGINEKLKADITAQITLESKSPAMLPKSKSTKDSKGASL